MKKLVKYAATVVLTGLLAGGGLPATAAPTPATAGAVAVGKDQAAAWIQAGAGSTDGIRDEFAKLRCLFFRC